VIAEGVAEWLSGHTLALDRAAERVAH
jgi:hypothetical protein